MANLETLELTINASAESAEQGINTLIGSLASLSTALIKPYSDLRDFNSALNDMKNLCKDIKLPNLSKMSGADSFAKGTKGLINQKGEILPEFKQYFKNGTFESWMYGPRPIPKITNNTADNTMIPDEEMRRRRPDWYVEPGSDDWKERVIERNEALKELNETTDQVTNSVEEQVNALTKQGTALEDSKKAIEDTNQAASKTKVDLSALKDNIKSSFSVFSKVFSRIKKIATTMLIRSALRALVKDVREGINNLYEWSKLTKGDFAKSMDTFKNKAGELKNTIGAAIAPIIQAAIPLINSLASAAINAFNWVNQLFSLLTGQNYWTKATEGVHDYAEEAKSAGGATKDWLAAFDELNVMNDSGGGGGGSSSKVDYSDMFENVTVFDQKIREVVDFLKDNVESIKDMAIAAGVAIASWKLGTAFLEILPTLSKIFGFVGTGAVIAITLQATWLLANQYMNTGEDGWLIAEALSTAVGSVAAWSIAKKLIGGKAGVYAAAITLSLSALTGIVANVNNTDVTAFSATSLKQNILDSIKMGAAAGIVLKTVAGVSGGVALAAAAGVAALTFGLVIGIKLLTEKTGFQWGNLNLTQDQINEYVKTKMFTSEAFVKVNKFNVLLSDKEELVEKIRANVATITSDLSVLQLGIDKDTTYANIQKTVSELVTDFGNVADINISSLKLIASSITMYNGEGQVISSDNLLQGILGWDKVKKEMEANGKELTDLLAKGARKELTPEMELYTQELLQKVLDMSIAISNAKEFGTIYADFRTQTLAAMSQGSIQGIADSYKNMSSSNEAIVRQAIKDQIASWYTLSELETDPELKAYYKQMADDLASGFERTVAEELKKQNAPGRDLIWEWILGAQGEGSVNSTMTKNGTMKYLKQYLGFDGFGDNNLAFMIKEFLTHGGVKKEMIDLMDLVGISGWNLFSDKLKEEFIRSTKLTLKNAEQYAKQNIPASDIIKFTDWDSLSKTAKNDLVGAIVTAYGAQGLNSIREKFPKIRASTICNVTNWDEIGNEAKNSLVTQIVMAYGTEGIKALKNKFPNIKATDICKITDWSQFSTDEKLNFLKALSDAFGSAEAVKAAKASGIDVADLVKQGMESKNPDIKKAAQAWQKIIDDGLDNPAPTATIKVVKDENSFMQTKKAIEALNQTVTISVKTVGLDEFGKAVKTTIKNAFGSIRFKFQDSKGNYVGAYSILPYAQGGIVDSGDIFMANENGNPEMIAKFGNKTGVANTEQMVEAMARGVQYANESQNALLREQNTLLRGILEKESTVRLGASAALGRVTRQSLEMYGGMIGG